MKKPHATRPGSPRRPVRPALRAAFAAALAGGLLATPAYALTFNVSYGSSVTNASNAATIEQAFNDAISFYQNTFTNNVTINLNVGWGYVGSTQIASGALGESSFSETTTNFSTLQGVLPSTALPLSDPTNGGSIYLSFANARVLGLLPRAYRSALDGSVGFDSTANWTFDPTQRAQSGAYDFIGVAEHEISEVLGRYSALPGQESVLDLYRYSAANTLDTTGASAYFSTDRGVTKSYYFNGNASAGDLGDWTGQSNDAFNYGIPAGTELKVSATDRQEMASLGYTLAAPVPEPAEAALMVAGLGLLGWRARRGPRGS